MKRIIISIFILASLNTLAQTNIFTKEDLGKELQPLKTSIQNLQDENIKLRTEVGNLKAKLSDVSIDIEALQKKHKPIAMPFLKLQTNLE